MTTNKPIRFRWVLVISTGIWGLLVFSIAFGVARKEFTFVHTFIPFAMLLVALAPLSAAKIVTHELFVPIAMTWAASAIIAIHFLGKWLTGLGPECDRVVLTASFASFGLINIGWMANRLRRWRWTAKMNRPAQENTVAITAVI